MGWEQTVSASFRARHDGSEADDAHGVLQSLEHTRARLQTLLADPRGDLTVVLHPGRLPLSLSNPLIVLSWSSAAPSSRRLVVGWASAEEIHVLSPAALRDRGEGTPGMRAALRLSAAALYTRRVLGASAQRPARMFGPVRSLRRVARSLRWAWLLEGSARWLAGQGAHTGPAIARRLGGGHRPAFPPGLRDAPLLGMTVCGLLAERAGGGERGERAVVRLATRPGPGGPQAALERAFGERLHAIESEWRAHLSSRPAAAARR